MKRETLRRVVLGSVLVCCMTAGAQEKGSWRAASSTARSVTGDVIVSDEKILIDFTSFPIARIRPLGKDELSAAFDADSNAAGSGSLYRLSIPAAKKFEHKNTLCGSDDTQWMATYVSDAGLQLAFFSGQKPPVLTIDAINSATNLCGTFAYGR
jgi:hypothetical protein